jgi:hypothetical protein
MVRPTHTGLSFTSLAFLLGCSGAPDPLDAGSDAPPPEDAASSVDVGITPRLLGSHRSRTLGDWMSDYWRVTLEGGPTTDGDLSFLLLPDEVMPVSGYDTGTRTVTVNAGQTLALTFYVWLGESYSDRPDDVPESAAPGEYFTGPRMHLRLTLDDTVLLDSDAGDSLAPLYFDTQTFSPPIVYPEPTAYGSLSALWVRGLGGLLSPLSPGAHTLRLVAFQDDYAVGFDTTWSITVR